MLGRKERGQLELFITGSLRSLIPDDHVLVRVDQVLDLEWLRAEVGALSCADNGRPGREYPKLCVSDRAHAVFRYGQASKRPANIMAS